MNKKISILLVLVVITVSFSSGCGDSYSKRNKQLSTKAVPEDVKNVVLSNIYGNITLEEAERVMLDANQVMKQVGLPEIEQVVMSSEHNIDDPNMLKSYLRFSRSESLIKEGMPRREYNSISNEFFDYVDQYPDVAALQKKVVEQYQKSNKQYAAVRQAKKVIAIDPNDMDTAIAIASVQFDTGRYEESLKYINLALQSSQSGTDNVLTAVATLNMAAAFAELGYTYAAAETYLRAWQLMKYHRQFEHYDPDVQKIIGSSEFQLLISARLYLQCGKIEDCIMTLRQVKLGPNFQQLISYLTPMVIELPEPQRVRFKMLVHLYLYLLIDGENPDFVLRIFYNNCLKMSLHNEYIRIVQSWYASGIIESDTPKLISRHSYARALEYAKRHTEARLTLKNSEPGQDTASAWLDFARIDRTNQSYYNMLQGYINCIDAGPQNLESVLNEFENILQFDQAAREELIEITNVITSKTFGSLIIRALIAENNKQNVLAEKLFRACLNKERENIVARKYLIRHYARVAKYQNLLVLAKGYNYPDITMYVARAYQSIGKFEKAVRYYQKILYEDKYNQQAVIRLSSLYRSLRRFDDAEKLLLRSSRRHPEQDQIQVEMIKLYSIWAMPNNAEQELAQNCSERVYMLAENYSRRYSISQPRQEKAENLLQENLEEFLEMHKSCKPARAVLCDSYFRTKKIDSAVTHAVRLMNMFGDDFQLLQKAADIFDSAEKYELSATARKLIWQKHIQTPETLKEAMEASRFAGLPSESLTMLNTGIELFSDDIKLVEAVADEAFYTYLIRRNYSEGIETFSQWLSICPDDCENVSSESLQYKLCLLLIYSSEFDQASDQLMTLYSDSSESSIFPAQMLVRFLNIRGMYEQSLSFLKDLIKILPGDIYLILEYAYTQIESGKTGQAINYVENWQQENPEASNRRYVLLNAYKRAGYYQQAIELTRHRLRDNPDDVDFQVDLAYCLIHMGDERSLNEASGVLDSLAEHKVDPYKWFDYRIILDLTRGNPEVASERLMQMTSEPDSPAVLASQARIYYMSGDTDKAIEMYQQVIKDYPDEISYRSQFSFVLENVGRIDDAIAQLKKIHELDSDNSMSKNNLAYTMINHNKDAEFAGRLIREAIYMSPENVAILDSVGWLYYKQGDFETALNYIYHAAAADIIVDPELMDHLGDTLYRLGQPEKAVIYWRRGFKEVSRRAVMEKNLNYIKQRYKRKIEQYNSGLAVEVAPVFSDLKEK